MPNPTAPVPDLPFAPWMLCRQPAGSAAPSPRNGATSAEWIAAAVPGTVASAYRAAGRWTLDQALDADAHDWWYRTTFAHPGRPCWLEFDGLATLAEVWLNGTRILETDNMFRSYSVDATPHLAPTNELTIVFRSLTEALKQKRPRPRWKTNLVAQQQLRWHRTTLLGRIPGWSPPVPPVGPWRDVRLNAAAASLAETHLTARLEGATGIVTLDARLRSDALPTRATLEVGSFRTEVQVASDGRVRAEMRIADPPLWWPHTHGEPRLHECALRAPEADLHLPLAAIGFRTLEATQDRFSVRINGEPIYCRGACWTTSDIVDLTGTPEALRRDLVLARDAGINMLRVGGTMVYESDAFYRLCDELGILVWQDFMFANMDYPVDDEAFARNIDAEAAEQLRRLARHPSVAVYCGNSEVEQQAAMLGMPRDIWSNRWFSERLPELCSHLHPGTAYVPSSPSGGVLPFHVRTGVAHYYGVGAYLRSPGDVRKDDVGFTSECLGFANIPDASTIDIALGGAYPALHHPRWKERVPRDTGTGWDFDDVRDFYLQLIFGVDPVRLRSFDPDRYLRLSRVATGEAMSQVFSEWRSGHSTNRGGLVWFYKDLWPGAGWGIVDSRGLPKAVYYFLRRKWQNRQIVLTNEGLEGFHLHAVNETSEPFAGYLELLLLKDGHVAVARKEFPCSIAPRSRLTRSSDECLDGFYDVAYAYRFGPPKHDVAVATLYDSERRVVSEAFDFATPRRFDACNASLTAEGRPTADGFEVTLRSDRFLQAVSVDAKGLLPDDNFFHLPPDRAKRVRLRPVASPVAKLNGYVEALNLSAPVKIATAQGATP